MFRSGMRPRKFQSPQLIFRIFVVSIEVRILYLIFHNIKCVGFQCVHVFLYDLVNSLEYLPNIMVGINIAAFQWCYLFRGQKNGHEL